ncbi:hypothetical protein RclHR1_00070046 [Rhizophagus clarus]|uniref:Uncharacterized protein n=1 Tax=Rhizophagus clarus TaxID=94130 RepID=A0A2Z6SKA4_9GLOM|nr:hypothetical protein RclHR1_00070046 [Rhizophagus clarus]GES78219.1 hypothetical protein GLOIN_2v1476208 [Rhizophagus clarus]
MYGLNYQIKERKKYPHESESDQIKNNRKENSNSYINSKKNEIKNYLFSRRIKLTLFSLSFLLIILFIFKIYNQKNFDSKFTYTTTCSFVDEIPDLEQVLKYRVPYRRVANMVERSSVFKSHSTQISEGLRDFCDKLLNASLIMNKIYREGIYLFKFFDEEFNLIKDRFFLDSSYRNSDLRYFFEKINNIIIKFKKFKQLVERTESFVDSFEHDRHVIEADIVDGLRDAQKFFIKKDYRYPSDNTIESTIVSEEIKSINNILLNLHDTAIFLDKVKKILLAYDENLIDISFKFENTIKDGIFEMSIQDIKYLEYSVEYLKSIHYKFIQIN